MTKLSQSEFDEMIARIRQGDQEAAAGLVRAYEPQIRREVRLRLSNPHLRQMLDSMDICQSVFGRFFVKASLGELDLDRPAQLLRLLCQMARNRIIDHHRRQTVRHPAGAPEPLLQEIALESESPSQIIQRRELMARMSELLTDREKQVAAMRRDGLGWEAIAAQVGGTAEAVRKLLSRAVERVTAHLELMDDE
ncbi:MAG: sigma-70 family RNA polymerase sigma factor [Planctomycetaceae bacterium]|nr:sigma-70 family RNA polymerase sigma factor [Planctomycetaceae bacterium]